MEAHCAAIAASCPPPTGALECHSYVIPSNAPDDPAALETALAFCGQRGEELTQIEFLQLGIGVTCCAAFGSGSGGAAGGGGTGVAGIGAGGTGVGGTGVGGIGVAGSYSTGGAYSTGGGPAGYGGTGVAGTHATGGSPAAGTGGTAGG
jgi:hypothetical protein